jgi:predicted O-linked N-acetylglucosamine transferase (SPINDLY family)
VLKAGPEAARYALIQLANARADQARVPEALASLERLLEPPPGSPVAWSNFLSLLHYDPARSPREIFDFHRRWGQRFGANPPARRVPSGRKRIRVGYLSPDFRAHPVGLLMEPVVAHHDRERVEVFLYHDSSVQDAVTSRLRGIDGVAWRDVGGVPDAALASRIRSDEIQVLMDLSGHLSGNRLGVFGARAAPLQGTWLGYPGTTGLPAMDFAITDPAFDPPQEGNERYSERLVRLNRPAFCFAPPEDAPPVMAPARGGTFRFGSFNNLRKMNDDVIEVWSRILARVTDSVLVMQTRALGDEGVRRGIGARFRAHGIGEERLEFHAASSLAEHLRLLSETHLCLDSWPWNGHMTTLNALWMGVPVLTLAGDRRAWRMGRCILSALGLDGLVTDSRDAFVETAVAAAQDAGLLGDLHAGLRQRLAESPLTDGRGLAAELERVYSTMLDEMA